MRTGLTILLLLLAVGCDQESTPDAGIVRPDVGTVDASFVRPDIPWLADGTPPIEAPRLTPCPSGWREVVDGDVTTCDLYPPGGPMDCPVGEAHFPGEPGCAVVGSPCPAGDFADDLPTDGSVIYVRPGATGGDGSEAAPFGQIGEAMAAATDSDTIALAKGDHVGTAVPTFPVTIRGACAAQSRLRPPPGFHQLDISASGVTIRDLTLEPDDRDVLVLRAGGAVLIEGAIIRGRVAVQGDASMRARSIVVEGVSSRRPFNPQAVYVANGELTIERAVMRDNTSLSLSAFGASAVVDLTDVTIRDTVPDPATGEGGIGVELRDGATLRLSRGSIEGSRPAAALAFDASTLEMSDVVIRGTRPDASARVGAGVYALDAAASLERVLVEDNVSVGVGVRTGDLSLTDVVVRDTAAQAGAFTAGASAVYASSSTTSVLRVRLERNAELGIGVSGGELTLEDVVVRDVAESTIGIWGGGMHLFSGATVSASRARFERAHEVAILAFAGSMLDMVDVHVLDTRARSLDGWAGRGLTAQGGSILMGSRLLIEGNREAAVAAADDGSEVTLDDVVIRDTLPRACATTDCASNPAGFGLSAFALGRIRLTRFVLTRSDVCGVQLARGGQVDLTDGEVSESSVGVCLQVPGYDVARLTERVLYRDNGALVEATDFAIPGAVDPRMP